MSRYVTELVWPPFKGKAHKVVDTSTGAGVGLYRTSTGAKRKAAEMNEAARQQIRGAQLAIAPDASIVAEPVQAPEPKHETVKLFEPAPTQLEGQMTL